MAGIRNKGGVEGRLGEEEEVTDREGEGKGEGEG